MPPPESHHVSRLAFGALVVVHGLITALIWAPRPRPQAPMDTSHSWLLGEARLTSLVLAVLSGLLIAASGIGLLAGQDWWAVVGLSAAALSLALFSLFFTPWWLLAIAFSTALGVAALRDLTGA